MPASYTIRRSVPRNTRRSKPASTPSTCFPSFSINLFMAFPLPLVICLPTQQTSYGNRKRHHRLVAAMPRYEETDGCGLAGIFGFDAAGCVGAGLGADADQGQAGKRASEGLRSHLCAGSAAG